ncbi:plastocyanin/azurin family copper-binding protein [Halolamina sp.]|uniref:plastocyanin/azurin family copper-binding protein n=1 Tax=Halolamina sp. TaxID=1940283 RepID=UPI0031F30C45
MRHDLSRRRFVTGVAATGLSLGLAGCSSSSAGSSDSPTETVDMTDDLAFAPKRIEVEAGTTVTWENVGSIGHSITAYEDEIPDGATYFASGGFDSQQAAKDGYPDDGNVTEGGTYEHTFETKGEYKYYCIPHEMNGMVGFVKVI